MPFVEWNVKILLKISLKFVPMVWYYNIPSVLQIMAWHWPGDKPLSEPIMVELQTHICVTQPQWVKAPGYLYPSCQLYSLYWTNSMQKCYFYCEWHSKITLHFAEKNNPVVWGLICYLSSFLIQSSHWCAILIAHQLLWQNMEAPVSIFQESPLVGEPRERLFHIHSIHRYQLSANIFTRLGYCDKWTNVTLKNNLV